MKQTKTCTKCGATLTLEHFHKQALGKYGVTSQCKPCRNADNSVYHKANFEQCRERLAEWRSRNPEKVKEQQRRAYRKNTARSHAASKRFQKQNPEKCAKWRKRYRDSHAEELRLWRQSNAAMLRQHAIKRLALESAATPPWLSKEEKAIISNLKKTASRISKCTGIRHSIDHVYPIKGVDFSGLNVPWNIQILTSVANSKKKNKSPIQPVCNS